MFYRFLIQFLSDEHYLFHTVAVFIVPVFEYARVALDKLLQFLLRSCGKPVAGFGQLFLTARSLEYVRHVLVVGKIA